MPTVASFSTMLNEYLPDRLLKEELLKRSWMLENVQKDNSWAGSRIVVPFRGSQASSITFGNLTASNDIAEDSYVRGTIETYQEVWGTMVFQHADLINHEGKIPEATFLKILPDQVDAFMDYVKMHTSIALTTGPSFARATADGTAGGLLQVNRIDRFVIGQRITIDDNDSAPVTAYVTAIDVNTRTITVSATRGGAALNIAAYTVAQGTQVFHPGVATAADTFVNLRSALLSAANGGSATIHGITKTAWPFLQAVNISGAGTTTSELLDKIFSAYAEIQSRARGGRCNTVLMSLQNLGVIMQLIQTEKGGFHVAPGQTKVSEYGWTEIMIGSPAGVMLKLVGVQEMDDDLIHFLDMKSMTFRSKGFFRKRKSPDGKEYFEVRNVTGYQYIVDLCLFGELEVSKPGNNGVLFGLNLTY